MQLMIAAAPPLRQMACGTQLPIANAAYRIENGVLCALPMPPALRGGAMLLTGAAGPFSPETAAGVVQECRRRRYGTVIVPFPAAELTEAERAQIEDIVIRKTGIAPENIVISTLADQ